MEGDTHVTVKLDVDVEYNDVSAELVKLVKDYTLQCLGFKVVGSYCHPSRNGRIHYRALVEAPDKFTEYHVAVLQYMLGDDPSRARLNMRRVTLGVYPPWGWNMLDIPPREVRERYAPDKCRDAARVYLRDGYSVIPVTWDKSPHPYLLSYAQGTLREMPWFYRGNYKIVYTGSFELEPFYASPQPQWFDKLFPAGRVDVLWLSGQRGSLRIQRIKGYGVAICTIPGMAILDFDFKEAGTIDALALAEQVAEKLNTFTVASPHRGIHVYLRYDYRRGGWRERNVELKVKGYCVAPPTKCFCEACRASGKGWVGVNYMPASQLADVYPETVVSLVYSLLNRR
jgi:hypothetical protein